MTEEEIRAHYKELHDTLSASYYAGTSGLTKEEFDLQHGHIWADMKAELTPEGYEPPPDPSIYNHPKFYARQGNSAEKINNIEQFLSTLSP